MIFFAVDGRGDPNSSPEYKAAIELLYGLSFTVKMSKKGGEPIEGYFDYVVPPLEGLWTAEDGKPIENAADKSGFCWRSMIRQPEFVTEEVFLWAKNTLKKKKPSLDVSKAVFFKFDEGLCAQAMHKGSYDNERETIEKLYGYAADSGLAPDFTPLRRHHEIYLSDPRRCAPEGLKTVIRIPCKEAKC
ncbi:MAG: GyrI-like domain-containing protein [Ruminococcus sp.]|nr:GyrI-like domain-containing protein [Ruminococcus sp.]